MKDRGVVSHCVALEGDVAGEMITSADQNGCELIALATYGRSGIERFIMGGIAEEVVRGTRRQALLTRALAGIAR